MPLCLPAFALTLASSSLAIAQDAASGSDTSSTPAAVGTGAWQLFQDSFDAFTVLLLIGSVTGVSLILMNIMLIREAAFLPKGLAGRCIDLAKSGRWEGLREAVTDGDSLLALVVAAGVSRMGTSKSTIREAAELVASEESARWFRRVDLLGTIGNLGPLVGLAGTVWGMILAFTSLGDHGGQAGPADLSLGISKALFHTLLGLCLAIPCLLAHSLLRSKLDRLCTRAIVVASEVVESVPEKAGSVNASTSNSDSR